MKTQAAPLLRSCQRYTEIADQLQKNGAMSPNKMSPSRLGRAMARTLQQGIVSVLARSGPH